MLRLLTILFVLVQAHAADPFQEGLASYQKRDYPAALSHFKAALEQGPPTARVLHNLALTHYQMNQKAFALAYWRKALANDPGFAAARTGRELLENRMHMRPFEQRGPDLTLRRYLEFVPPFVASWIFAVALAIFAWVFLRYLGARRTAHDEERTPPGLSFGLVAAAAPLAATAVVLALKLSYGLNVRATVVAEQAGVRSLPDEQAATLFEVAAGGEVLVRRSEPGWVQVQNADGATGWVKDSELIVTSDI